MRYRFHPLLLIVLAGCATPAAPPTPVPSPPATAPEPQVTQPFFTQTGTASFYGATEDGNLTANGESFDQTAFTAAHRTLAFGTVVRVTNLANGRIVKVAINDRGPRVDSRIIDLSTAAARALGMQKRGIIRVRLEAFHADQPGTD